MSDVIYDHPLTWRKCRHRRCCRTWSRRRCWSRRWWAEVGWEGASSSARSHSYPWILTMIVELYGNDWVLILIHSGFVRIQFLSQILFPLFLISSLIEYNTQILGRIRTQLQSPKSIPKLHFLIRFASYLITISCGLRKFCSWL